jgi:NTP pyrophosphatase (non-canonical NTP hydrolase)
MSLTELIEIQAFQSFLATLYANSNRAQSWEYMHGYLSRSIGYLGKAAVTDSETRTLYFVRALSWTLALASKLEVKLQAALISRFPGHCPYCLESVCVCFRTHKQPTRKIPAYRLAEELDIRRKDFRRYFQEKQQPITLSSMGECIARIYPSNEIVWYYSGPWHHFVKLHEEIAEVHEAASKYAKGSKPIESVAEELADVLAWLLSAWYITMRPRRIEDAFIDYYLSGCPICHNSPCACTLHSSRPTGLVDLASLEVLEGHLRGLEQVAAGAGSVEQLHSLAAAKASGSDSLARSALSQLRDWLSKMDKWSYTSRESRERGVFLVQELTKVVEVTLRVS